MAAPPPAGCGGPGAPPPPPLPGPAGPPRTTPDGADLLAQMVAAMQPQQQDSQAQVPEPHHLHPE